MKSTGVVVCLVCLAMPVATAGAGDVSFDGSLGLYSSYIWRGYRLSEDALQVQPSATVGVDGFSLNIWADYDFDTEEWLEVDYTASYAHDLDAFGLEVGYTHFDVREGLDSDELYVSAGFDSFLNPSLTAFLDVNQGDGAFVVADISHPVELTERTSLEFGASVSLVVDNSYVATDANGNEFTGLFNGHLSSAGSIAVTDRLSIEPMVGYTFALSGDASDAIKAGSTEPEDSFFYGAVTVSMSF
jgi:hypothetical protein